MKKHIYRSMLVAAGFVVSSPLFANPALQAAADDFKSEILAGTAIIGLVMLGAAFGAIVWNWLKAAIFS